MASNERPIGTAAAMVFWSAPLWILSLSLARIAWVWPPPAVAARPPDVIVRAIVVPVAPATAAALEETAKGDKGPAPRDFSESGDRDPR